MAVMYIRDPVSGEFVPILFSGATGEEIRSAVNEYLERNPVTPGATKEEATQIKENTEAIKRNKGAIDGLTPDAIGALPKNGTAANANQLNGKDAEYYATDESVNQLSQQISDEYSASKTYNSGDYCIYANTLYKCLHDNVTGIVPTNTTYWEAVTVGGEIGEALKPIVYDRTESLVASENSSYSGQCHYVDSDGLYLILTSCRTEYETAPPRHLYINGVTNGTILWASAGTLSNPEMLSYSNPANAITVAKILKGQYFQATGYNYSDSPLQAAIKITATKISGY